MKKWIAFFILIVYNSCTTPQALPGIQTGIFYNKSTTHQYTGTEKNLKVRVKVVILKTDDGKGNFNLNNPEEAAIFKESVQNALNNFSSWKKPADLTGCYTGTDFYPTTGLDFVVEYVNVNNTFGWNYLNSGSDMKKGNLSGFSPSTNWYLRDVDRQLDKTEGRQKFIHVYFTMDGDQAQQILFQNAKPVDPAGKAAGQFPTTQDLTRTSQVHIPNGYLKYKYMRDVAPLEYQKPWSEVRNWLTVDGSKGLSHELGHVFGLAHNNQYHGSNKCGYSIMSQKHTDPRNYLQPTEIQKVHENLSKTNLMQFVTDESHYGKTVVIESDTTWNVQRRFFADFELSKGKTLTVSKPIFLPTNSKFTLMENSRVIFTEEGKITYPDGTEFKGWIKNATAQIIQQ